MSLKAPPQSVIILGGGTAGWMAANILQKRWGGSGTVVTLIESKDIGIIGVGEGSTPQLKAFFDELGIAEDEWMPRCNATYKAGIEFVGWSDRPGHERYFHPFATSVDPFTEQTFFQAATLRRKGADVPAHPDPFFLATRIAREGRAPLAPANFPFEVGYGYHFDAYLVGATLREFAVARGVKHETATIANVTMTEAGDIGALVADDGRSFSAELYLDASGFRASLIEGALKEPHRGFGDNLFNDRAVVAPTPLPASGAQAMTRATAASAGWIWHIPLTNRAGNGYVYSSRYIDPDDAAAELRRHCGLDEDAEVRHLAMRCGRVERSWVRNCLAIGLAQGFLEPLEATALHIVLATVQGFTDAYERDDRDGFNRSIARRYEGIRDYIVCHYRTALRRDTPYWRDAAAHDRLSDSLKGIMTAWFTGADIEEEVHRQEIAAYYAPMSWNVMLAGYGNFPPRLSPVAHGPVDLAAVERFVGGCALNFPSHGEALSRLAAAKAA
ncbi:tryptophan halogenase family protein [Sphingomonas sp. LHG3406-1]|uniref:tryptophan halogenase family protein n=1 Tax=Sphingomonas sp. LHG3406-1 TaxID=2804617 RepID=UPI002613E75E|nr:tryptophan halogenase family protein [Sphingomonas sp. LHG3406-1]